MKHFSKHWKGSIKPKKQRKYRKNAPLHLKTKMLSANLAKDLRKKHKTRNVPLRKGDNVKIVRGQYKKRTGKIDRVDKKEARVYVEGIEFIKKDGSKAKIPLQPSNLQITILNMDDKKRTAKLAKQGVKQ